MIILLVKSISVPCYPLGTEVPVRRVATRAFSELNWHYIRVQLPFHDQKVLRLQNHFSNDVIGCPVTVPVLSRAQDLHTVLQQRVVYRRAPRSSTATGRDRIGFDRVRNVTAQPVFPNLT